MQEHEGEKVKAKSNRTQLASAWNPLKYTDHPRKLKFLSSCVVCHNTDFISEPMRQRNERNFLFIQYFHKVFDIESSLHYRMTFMLAWVFMPLFLLEESVRDKILHGRKLQHMKNKEGEMQGKLNLERANSDDQILLHLSNKCRIYLWAPWGCCFNIETYRTAIRNR